MSIWAGKLDRDGSYCFICAHAKFLNNAQVVCRYRNSEFGDVYDPSDCDDYEPDDDD